MPETIDYIAGNWEKIIGAALVIFAVIVLLKAAITD